MFSASIGGSQGGVLHSSLSAQRASAGHDPTMK